MARIEGLASQEQAEQELELIAQRSGHATFRALLSWLRANRESENRSREEIRDEFRRGFEFLRIEAAEIKAEVKRTNGSVAEAHDRISGQEGQIDELAIKARLNRELIDAKKEWDANQRLWRVSALGGGCAVFGALIGAAGHGAGWW